MADGGTFDLGTLIAAAGALGVAAYGVVDGLKGVIPSIRQAGFKRIERALKPIRPLLDAAYGGPAGTDVILRSAYVGKGGEGVIRQAVGAGLRTGLVTMSKDALKAFLESAPDGFPMLKGVCAETAGADAIAEELVRRARDDAEDAGDLRAISAADLFLTRLEMAVQSRLEASLRAADHDQASAARLCASAVAIGVGGVVSLLHPSWRQADLPLSQAGFFSLTAQFVLYKLAAGVAIGVLAVPIAPIAKDLSKAVAQASQAVASLNARR